MITKLDKAHGEQPAVKVSCDGKDCTHEWTVNCDYQRTGHGQFVPNTGQVNKKLVGSGWSVARKKQVCPACVAAKAATSNRKPAVTSNRKPASDPPRQPTRLQKREIMDLLDEVYDTDAECYRRGDTDQSVADVLSVMPGWVTNLREEFFGPAGGNEDIEELEAKLDDIEARLVHNVKHGAAIVSRMEAALEEAAQARADLKKIKRAVGERVLSVAGLH